MFTGIVETLGSVKSLRKDRNNLHITVESTLASELKIDQSLAHNGVCLTVVNCNSTCHTVTAIKETLNKTSLGRLQTGDLINLERAMILGGRLDGHIVQGHVDQTGRCIDINEAGGSRNFTFEYDPDKKNITIEKGSIAVNGISLTVVNSQKNKFSVSVIPYTFEHTNFHCLEKGSIVNLEFDLFGKYIGKYIDGLRQI